MSEYAFLTSAPLYNIDGQLTAYGASARLGTVVPAMGLGRLGYDARAVSVASDLAVAQGLVRNAKRIVFGEMWPTKDAGWSAAIGAYRSLLGLIEHPAERAVFSIADDHFAYPEFAGFYREALRDCLAVTVVSQNLKTRVAEFTSRPVMVMPEPVEGVRGAPQAIAARRVSAPVAWLAARVGLSMDHWRVRLLWFGYPQNLPPLMELLPALEEYAATYPLLLTCITSQAFQVKPELAHEKSRLRVQFVAWSPRVMDAAIASSDVVLIPSSYRDPVNQAKSPNRLIAGLHGGRFVVAHPLPAYAPYADFAWVSENLVEGVDWAVRHPREAVERIARGQAFIEARHSPEAVARFWLDVFHSR